MHDGDDPHGDDPERWRIGDTPTAPAILAVCVLLLAALLLGELLHRFHVRVLTHSGAIMLLGMLANGCVLLANNGHPLLIANSPTVHDLIYYALLPPIIYEAGFSMRKRGFFANFVPILLLSVLGTLISILSTGFLLYGLAEAEVLHFKHGELSVAEAMLFGSLISSTDPVATLSILRGVNAPPLLYDLIFGESALNDALSIVFFNAFRDQCKREMIARHEHPQGVRPFGAPAPPPLPPFSPVPPDLDAGGGQLILEVIKVFVCSVLLGVATGLASAALTRRLRMWAARRPAVELLILLCFALIAYTGCEVLELSGILALFFAGITMRHWTFYNLSQTAQASAASTFETLAALGEASLSLLVGVAFVDFVVPHVIVPHVKVPARAVWNAGLVGVVMPVLLIARALNVFPMTHLANRNFGERNRQPISLRMQAVIWWSGLRGAVSFALAMSLDDSRESHQVVSRSLAGYFNSTTLAVILATNLLLAPFTGPIIRRLRLAAAAAVGPTAAAEPTAPLVINQINADAADAAPTPPAITRSSSAKQRWKSLDERWIKPYFGGSGVDRPGELS